MLVCDITGNFGNHLVDYVLTRVVAEKNGFQWGFNRTPSHDYYGGKEQLDFMNIDYGVEHHTPYGEIPDGIKYIWEEKRETFYHIDRVDYHPFQPDVFNICDNTKLIIYCCQDARYYEDSKDKIKNWLSIKESCLKEYNEKLYLTNIILDMDTCIINVRGGEYKSIPNVLLRKEYWDGAMRFMKMRNKNIKFVVVTDDVPYAQSLFPEIKDIYHFSIGMDYYIINNAHNLILSNSSFAIFPAWLNPVPNKMVVAPRFWARHNVSSGYWASSDVFTFGWWFLDRNGYFYEK